MRFFGVIYKAVFGLVFFSFAAIAQEEPAAAAVGDPLDLSAYEAMIVEEGFPSVDEVNSLEVQANDAFKSGDCDAALPVIVEYYTKANKLGNVIKQGLEPFYSAGYQERKDTNLGPVIDELAGAETAFNQLVRKRNAAWVMEAECLIKSGEKDEGIIRLFRALEFISIGPEDRALWEKARILLWEQVGYKL